MSGAWCELVLRFRAQETPPGGERLSVLAQLRVPSINAPVAHTREAPESLTRYRSFIHNNIDSHCHMARLANAAAGPLA